MFNKKHSKPQSRIDSLIGAGRFKVTPDDSMLEFRLKVVGAYRWRRLWRNLRGESVEAEATTVAPASGKAASGAATEGVSRG